MLNKDFYPTPNKLIEKMLSKVDLKRIKYILEPSGGKGDIIDFIREKTKYSRYGKPIIDTIEIEEDLQSILKDKDCNLIHDDFLTFETYKKYGLIVMNPPFSQGCKHLLKAIELQKRGGEIVCILNAETIKNSYTDDRNKLIRLLEKYDAEIEYIEEAFVKSERKTSVEIALIHISIENDTENNLILDKLKNSSNYKQLQEEQREVVAKDPVQQAIARFKFEIEAGIELIYNYNSLVPIIQSDLKDDRYSRPILEVKLNNQEGGCSNAEMVNKYIEEVRYKYWKGLIDMDMFRQVLTTDLINQFADRLEKLKQYDFTEFNIEQVMSELKSELYVSVEDTIYELFKDFTYRYSYNDFSSNVHMYDGWKTNKSYKINDKKVIMPNTNGYDSWDGGFQPSFNVEGKLRDIEKALNYLDGGRTDDIDDIGKILRNTTIKGQSKNIEFKYFFVNFYKKGTAHLVWKDKDLIKKLNIFGSKREGGLPPTYGTKAYKDMSNEERAVIDSFEGEKEYEKTMQDKSFYLESVGGNLLSITG